MKKVLFLFFSLFLFLLKSSAQVFYIEDFTNGGLGWTLNNVLGPEGANPNLFVISAAEGGGIPPDLDSPSSCNISNNSNNSLHLTSFSNPTGGAIYDNGFNATTFRRVESPIIDLTGKMDMTIAFNYIERGQNNLDNAKFWYFDGTSWTMLHDINKTNVACIGKTAWKKCIVALPVSANNNATVRYGFSWENNEDGIGDNISFAIDNITITNMSPQNPLTTTFLGTNLCGCQNVFVPYYSGLSFNAGNIISVYLSDEYGSFGNSTFIGVANKINNIDSILCTIPCYANGGNLYRIRVESSNPNLIGVPSSTISIIPNVATTVKITTIQTMPACVGASIDFVANITYAGTSPTYAWRKNGIPVGTNSATYSSNSLNNGDVITIQATSNSACITNSNEALRDTFIVNIADPPAVTANAFPFTLLCAGDSVSLNGGNANTFVWSGGHQNGVYFYPFSNAIYTVTGTDVNGCTSVSTVGIIVQPSTAPTIEIFSTPSVPYINNMTIYEATIPVTITNFKIEWFVNGQFYITKYSPYKTLAFAPTNITDSVYGILYGYGMCFNPDSSFSNVMQPQYPATISENLPLEIKMYPNPIENTFWLEGLKEKDKISLSDMSGKILFEKIVDNNNKLEIDLSKFSSSLYFLKLEIENKKYNLKLLKN